MARKKIIKFDDDFGGALFGIATQLKDYQLSWHINRSLNLNLIRMEDIEILHKKKNKTAVFSLYRHEDDLDKCIVYVVSNKYLGEQLIPEVKQADFLLMIQGEVNDERKNEIHSALKNIPAIQFMMPLEYSKLKSKDNLVFE